ncbi:MAG: leucine-rich repeat domain-containing protein [Chloroflexaceae bacterium]|nr:leucine-rich repeat domain-containing protein [Chloroflexaceae bacterium]
MHLRGTLLDFLRAIPQLTDLCLARATIDEAVLRAVQGCATLRRLDLWRTAITDAAVKMLASMHQLQELNLGDTAISDAGVRSLYGLSNLRHLDLSDTQVGAAGIMGLRQRLPECTIIDAEAQIHFPFATRPYPVLPKLP